MSGRIRDALLISFVIISLLFVSALSSYSETVNYVYDELSRLIRVEYGDGTVIEYIYDNTGNRTHVYVGEFPLTVNVVGNGTVTKNPDQPFYTTGTDVTLTAVNGSQTFSEWSGDLTGSTNPAVIVMDGHKSVTATFVTLVGWLQGWTYRKTVTLSRASGAVTNYQMRLLVGETSGASGENVDCNGHVQADFDDLRFTTSDGATLLDYWIESITGTTPNQLAAVWIEFDSIGTTDTTFYMYYGNVGASAVSNGASTFIFFDNFNRPDSQTVGNGWTEDPGDDFSIENNKLKIIQGNAGNCYKSNAFSGQTIVEFKAQVNSTAGECQFGTYGAVNNRYGALKFNGASNQIWYLHSGGWGVIQNFSANTDYIFGIRHDVGAGNVDYYLNREVKQVDKTPYTSTITNRVNHFKNGAGTILESWVLIRRNLDTEPAWGSWGAEEAN